MRDTFVDLPENRTKNGATGKPVALMIAQRGGGDCKQMHEPVYPQPKKPLATSQRPFVSHNGPWMMIVKTIGCDGEAMPEKDVLRKWEVLFPPSVIVLAK